MGQFQPLSRADYGSFYTPQTTAAFMVSLLDLGPQARILEPAAGDGVFIDALLDRGVSPEQITAWEFDPTVARRLRRRYAKVQIQQRDSLLDTDLEREEGFDLIVGNPPYLNKQSAYIRAHRQQLTRRYGPIVGAGETFTMFTYLGLELLRDQGQLVFITGDTIRTLATHEKLRRLVGQNFSLDALVSPPRGLFSDASVATTIFKISRRQQATTIAVLSQTDDEGDYQARPWQQLSARQLSLLPGRPWLYELPRSIVALFRSGQSLSDLAEGRIGMHTRSNATALAAIEGSDMARRFAARPQRPGHYRVISATEAASDRWRRYLKQGGEQDFWAAPDLFVDWDPERRRHYVIPDGPRFGEAGLAISGIAGRLSARIMESGCLWDTNKVIGFIPHDPTDRDWLLALLNSDLYSYLLKAMICDSSSAQLSDLDKLPIPALERSARQQLADFSRELVELVRQQQDGDQLRRELNRQVYRILAISKADQERVRHFLDRRGLRHWS